MNYLAGFVKFCFVLSLFILSKSSIIKAAESVVSKEESELVRLMNLERSSNHLPILKVDFNLMDVARYSSQYMAERDESSHHCVNGKRVAQRVKESGYCNHDYSTEVILRYPLFTNHNNFVKVLKCWMDSPSHKNIILANNKEELGVGMATSRNSTTYFTAVFSSKVSPYENRTSYAQSPQVSATSLTSSLLELEIDDLPQPQSIDDLPLPQLPINMTLEMADLSLGLLLLINKERARAGMCSLEADTTLVMLAENDANYMAVYNKLTYNHGNKTPTDRIIESGFCTHRYSTEIISVMSDRNLESVVQKWMNSSTSKQILDGNYQTTGVGMAPVKNGKIYIAQILTRKTPFYKKI